MKLIVVTFAGRKRYLETLFKYIKKNKNYIYEYHLYLATTNDDDINYIYQFQKDNSDFVKIISLDNYEKFNKVEVWNLAYKNCLDENVIYLKLDDDVVFIDENLFTKFIEFRLNSSSPIVFPHIINNIISTPLLETYNKIESEMLNDKFVIYTWKETIKRIKPQIEALKSNFRPKEFVVTNLLSQNEILCPVAWGNKEYSKIVHSLFLDLINQNRVDYLYTENIVLDQFLPISIQCCSWLGKDLKRYTESFGDVGTEDEPWISVYLPIWAEQPNVIYGKSVVSHFSSYHQELYLINSGILDRYKSLL